MYRARRRAADIEPRPRYVRRRRWRNVILIERERRGRGRDGARAAGRRLSFRRTRIGDGPGKIERHPVSESSSSSSSSNGKIDCVKIVAKGMAAASFLYIMPPLGCAHDADTA